MWRNLGKFDFVGRLSVRDYWLCQLYFILATIVVAFLSLWFFKTTIRPHSGDDVVRFVLAMVIFAAPLYLWRYFLWMVLGLLASLFFGLLLTSVGHTIYAGWVVVRETSQFIAPMILPAVPMLLLTILVLPVSVSVAVKRFHDRNLPGILVLVVPELIGLIIDILGSQKENNRYGPPPR